MGKMFRRGLPIPTEAAHVADENPVQKKELLHFFRTSAFGFPVISSAAGWREASGLECCRPGAWYGGKETGRRRGDYS